MLKKLFISFLACFTLIFTTVGGYAQATTGNPALDTINRINKALFATVATGLAGSAAIGIKAKEIYDNNKGAVYDGAIKAYDTMSDSAKQSWASAVARGNTAGNYINDELSSVFANIYSSVFGAKATIPDAEFDPRSWYEKSFVFTTPAKMKLTRDYGGSTGVQTYIDATISSFLITLDDSSFVIKFTTTDGESGKVSSGSYAWDAPVLPTHAVIENVNTVADLVSFFNIYTNYWKLVVGGNATDKIYDQALNRLLENDIPKMKDAGLVVPQADIRTPAGTRINLDANTGTMTLPDGTMWNGNSDDLIINIPDAVISHGDAVWSDGTTDTNIWTGERTTTATGEAVDTGQSALDRILEGIEDLPADLTNILTKLFVPTTIASSWADITTTLQSRLKLPSFGWLVTDGIVCTESGKDVRITFNGETTTFVDMSWLYSVRSFYMPVMRGFLWFLFGWYVYRKAIAITNKVDGIEK